MAETKDTCIEAGTASIDIIHDSDDAQTLIDDSVHDVTVSG